MKRITFSLIVLLFSVMGMAQSILPFVEDNASQNKYSLVDYSLLKKEPLVTYHDGTSLIAYLEIVSNHSSNIYDGVYYITLKYPDNTLFYGFVRTNDGELPTHATESLNGVLLWGNLLDPATNEVFPVAYYTPAQWKKWKTPLVGTFYKGLYGWFQTNWFYREKYIFNRNLVTSVFDAVMGSLAPQESAGTYGNRYRGYTTSITGGYYYYVDGVCTKNGTVTLKNDLLTIKYKPGYRKSVSARLDMVENTKNWIDEEDYDRIYHRQITAQWKRDLPYNRHVKKDKARMLNRVEGFGEDYFDESYDLVGISKKYMVLKKLDTEDVLDFHNYEFCYADKDMSEWNIYYVLENIFKSFRKEHTVKSYNSVKYDVFADKFRKMIGLIRGSVKSDKDIFFKGDTSKCLSLFKGLGDYLLDIHSSQNNAQLMFIGNYRGEKGVYTMQIVFNDKGLIDADSMINSFSEVMSLKQMYRQLMDNNEKMLSWKKSKDKAEKRIYKMYKKTLLNEVETLDINYNSLIEFDKKVNQIKGLLIKQQDLMKI